MKNSDIIYSDCRKSTVDKLSYWYTTGITVINLLPLEYIYLYLSIFRGPAICDPAQCHGLYNPSRVIYTEFPFDHYHFSSLHDILFHSVDFFIVHHPFICACVKCQAQCQWYSRYGHVCTSFWCTQRTSF